MSQRRTQESGGIVLIANRGEIVRRVARSAKKLGFRVVTVFEDSDRSSPHVDCGDLSIDLGCLWSEVRGVTLSLQERKSLHQVQHFI